MREAVEQNKKRRSGKGWRARFISTGSRLQYMWRVIEHETKIIVAAHEVVHGHITGQHAPTGQQLIAASWLFDGPDVAGRVGRSD